ncbi:MAG: glycosyltransferase family 4 protein [Phycisphaerae bacterium]|nr:glycosyltransferase family 4 protein [Phycisphaerae bacterium]
MHVAYIHQHFSTRQGSGGTRSYEFGKRLLAGGHRVSMISGAFVGAERSLGLVNGIEERDVDGIRVFYINEPYENKLGFWKRAACFGRFARKARGVVEQLDADLVFATSTPLTVGIPGMKGARKLGVPFVFEVRDLWPDLLIQMGVIRNPLLKWHLRRMERRIYRAADHIIALSPGMVDGIVGTGYPRQRVTMIPNASDVDLFKPEHTLPKEKWIGDPACCRFVFSGAHGLANGLDALIDTAAELKRRGEGGIQFVCIGDGSLKSEHMRRSEALGLQERILWCDPIPKAEFAAVLPTFDVGLMVLRNVPGFWRGTSPNKFFDYIACGLAVLNNYPGWLGEMITRGGFGKLAAPDDPSAFADACVWFRDHPEQRNEMGRRAREWAVTECSREKRSTQFLETLERVHDEARREWKMENGKWKMEN